MKQRLLKWLTRLTVHLQPPEVDKEAVVIQPTGFSTEPASVGVPSDLVLVKGLAKESKMNHQDLRNLGNTFFNTDIPSSYFCFKGGGPYGVVMKIFNVGMITDENDKLSDILLHMSDTSMGTSLTLTVSVKDLKELLVPFFPKKVVFS